MALFQKFTREFSNRSREEGWKIFHDGGVEIDDNAPEWVDATVQGAQPYGVSLTRHKGMVQYSCDCPHYGQTGQPCKHVWATLLAANAKGLTDQWDTSRQLDLLPEEDPDEDDYAIEYDDGSDFAASAADRWVRTPPSKAPGARRRLRHAGWKKSLGELRSAMKSTVHASSASWPPSRELLYIIDAHETLKGRGLTLELSQRERKKNGDWGKPKRQSLTADHISVLPDGRDREIMSMLLGARNADYGSYYSPYSYGGVSTFRVGEAMLAPLIERMCRTGRCMVRPQVDAEPMTLVWDETGTWELWMTARFDPQQKSYFLTGELRRGQERMELSEPLLLVTGGVLFARGMASPLDDGGAFPWVVTLRHHEELEIPASDRDELLQQLLTMPQLPRLDLPDELKVEEVRLRPRPRLRIHKPAGAYYNRLHGELSFDYEGVVVSEDEPGRGIYQADRRRLVLRDHEFEREAAGRICALGFKKYNSYYNGSGNPYELVPNSLPAAIRKLTSENWHIEADGKLYRQPGAINIEVTSGIDWFELHGTADFNGQTVKLPTLLAALRRGENTVRLDDGTFGILPEQWLAKYGLLADMGTATDDHIRFGHTQVGVLDALLATQPEARCDEVFEQARQRMRNFQGIEPADPPETFVGTLRPYQRDGLGWMQFLRDFHFGGCLADDMGLGKTVQVLALLEARRQLRTEALPSLPPGESGSEGKPCGTAAPGCVPSTADEAGRTTSNSGRTQPGAAVPHVPLPGQEGAKRAIEGVKGPSLVVAPRSLIFNWKEEANKFAPNLRVLDHTGIGRTKSADAINQHDLVLTTYGTLRNDAAFLKDVNFDYVVLDEAQAIKNANSESAKATRLLQGRHRLALSGTPVQNHLGELWSLFEFLNPGMLGTARAFQATTGGARIIEPQSRELLSRALRPFILRRTKQQVAKDLPQRIEQTLYCELDAEQRKLYVELKEHYRQSLMTRIATEGIKKAKIQILEALLRLRQAACHPGLIDKSKTQLGSAKLDSLLANISEVIDEDHKVLVFSQFTSFLAIVRQRLDKDKVRYEYLDGRTRDRAAVVEKFQTDPECKLFLISLKAGGLGLNLTAAEYVFLLDPWWNPAVEAQAIDRAHRIGQSRQVFAYRLIAKDTVEEKVLQLQQTKRDLADAIIGADNSLISKLGRDDLELLLS
ncbi:MAG TPA: SNF2-related protein [Tepidisphaeraceae bacterium]|nr:SNF2-related protein [Tepidisphaeraceae bacterium]